MEPVITTRFMYNFAVLLRWWRKTMTTGLRKLFGANLKAFRKNNELTQSELAEKVDKSIDLISQIERGASSPSFETIEDLSKALSVSPQAFFNGSGLLGGKNTTKFAKLQSELAKLSEEDLEWVESVLKAVLNR